MNLSGGVEADLRFLDKSELEHLIQDFNVKLEEPNLPSWKKNYLTGELDRYKQVYQAKYREVRG